MIRVWGYFSKAVCFCDFGSYGYTLRDQAPVRLGGSSRGSIVRSVVFGGITAVFYGGRGFTIGLEKNGIEIIVNSC